MPDNEVPESFQGKTQYPWRITFEEPYMITLALAGKPNCGKSTFFKAATMANVEIANYPFTTINPNFGVDLRENEMPMQGSSPDLWTLR